MEILGLIPARGGSKSIPHKNIVKICGKPLISYTFEAAQASEHLSRIILSTDDEKIAAVGKQWNIEVPFLRPLKFSTDDSPMIDVVLHTLSWFQEKENYVPDLILLLQPTSPLRNTKHIDEALELFLKSDADSLVSVVDVPHNYNPVSLMKKESGKLKPFLSGEGFRVLRRQDKPKVYARNGPAILIMRRTVLENTRTLYGESIQPYIMGWPESIDIDSPYELALVQCILKGD